MINYQQLVESSADAILVCDKSGRLVIWNAAAVRLFGYSAEEALGQSLDIIIPPKFRLRHWQGYDETLKTGITKYGSSVLRVPALHKDGYPLSIAFTVSLLSQKDGAPTAIVAIVRDESRAFAQEQSLKQRIQELEEAISTTEASQHKFVAH